MKSNAIHRKEEKAARPLQKMFQAVPPSYDRINRLLTFGIDEYWRKKAAKRLLSGNPARVLDLCTGTGDLALHLRKKAKPETTVLALDFSEPMLDFARSKASGQKLNDIEFIHGDAANMPFDDNSLDGIGIAFAFRNLTYKNPDRARFLNEILRVLRPGAPLIAVDTSQPDSPLIRKLLHAYMKYITGPVGGRLSGHRSAYRYLAHSAIDYYTAPDLKRIILEAGFKSADYIHFLTGVTALWECRK
ncbi:MAG: ubiquinone/menaquinone biosynthesis methyltransferase [Bacteroidales bacterium]